MRRNRRRHRQDPACPECPGVAIGGITYPTVCDCGGFVHCYIRNVESGTVTNALVLVGDIKCDYCGQGRRLPSLSPGVDVRQSIRELRS